MENFLIISISSALVGFCILYGAAKLKQLRKEFAKQNITPSASVAPEQIVKIYWTEENYQRKRTRVWLLMIGISATIMLFGFGGSYCLQNKEKWAAEAEQKKQEKLRKLNCSPKVEQSKSADQIPWYSEEAVLNRFARYKTAKLDKTELKLQALQKKITEIDAAKPTSGYTEKEICYHEKKTALCAERDKQITELEKIKKLTLQNWSLCILNVLFYFFFPLSSIILCFTNINEGRYKVFLCKIVLTVIILYWLLFISGSFTFGFYMLPIDYPVTILLSMIVTIAYGWCAIYSIKQFHRNA